MGRASRSATSSGGRSSTSNACCSRRTRTTGGPAPSMTGGPPRPAGLPLYTLRCVRGPLEGQTLRTTDPGWGLVTGRCADVGKFKVPALRGLAGRPPYFHDGSAATLEEVVASYERRFAIGLSPAEKQDLVAFLRAL